MTNQIGPGYHEATRHQSVKQPDFDPSAPRLGRRESEPHSIEVMYLKEVLDTNFPSDRAFWDLHHYFLSHPGGDAIDIQFDVTYFKDFELKEEMRSYKAVDFDNRIPVMAINILSTSTWAIDLSDNLDTCRLLGVPLYVVFAPYHVATNRYKPPFARVYWLEENGDYKIHELRRVIVKEKQMGLSKALDASACEDESQLIDTSPIVPFRLGLMVREKRVWGEAIPAHRLVLVHPTEPYILPNRLEIALQRAEEEKQRAEEEKQRAEEEKQRADRLESLLEKYKDQFGDLT